MPPSHQEGPSSLYTIQGHGKAVSSLSAVSEVDHYHDDVSRRPGSYEEPGGLAIFQYAFDFVRIEISAISLDTQNSALVQEAKQ